MGIIARYLDVLPGAARARVIVAQKWTAHRMLDPDGCRCLVGHAENWGPAATADGVPVIRPGDRALTRQRREMERRYRRGFHQPVRMSEVDLRWDRLVARLGIVRAVQLAKRRAARLPARREAAVERLVALPTA